MGEGEARRREAEDGVSAHPIDELIRAAEARGRADGVAENARLMAALRDAANHLNDPNAPWDAVWTAVHGIVSNAIGGGSESADWIATLAPQMARDRGLAVERAEARGRASRDGEVERLTAERDRADLATALIETVHDRAEADRDAARAEVATLTTRHAEQVRRTSESQRHAANQRKEIARLTKAGDELREEALRLRAEIARVGSERDALRAILHEARAALWRWTETDPTGQPGFRPLSARTFIARVDAILAMPAESKRAGGGE